jgi:hypothetical protein
MQKKKNLLVFCLIVNFVIFSNRTVNNIFLNQVEVFTNTCKNIIGKSFGNGFFSQVKTLGDKCKDTISKNKKKTAAGVGAFFLTTYFLNKKLQCDSSKTNMNQSNASYGVGAPKGLLSKVIDKIDLIGGLIKLSQKLLNKKSLECEQKSKDNDLKK